MIQIFSLLAGVVQSIVADWTTKRQNQRDIEKAVVDNKIRLAQAAESHNEAWEMAALEGRDTGLRRVSFLIWSTPILWSAWDAPAAAAFFRDALGALPDWYIAGYLAISGAVWGISELKAAGVWKK